MTTNPLTSFFEKVVRTFMNGDLDKNYVKTKKAKEQG